MNKKNPIIDPEIRNPNLLKNFNPTEEDSKSTQFEKNPICFKKWNPIFFFFRTVGGKLEPNCLELQKNPIV